MIWIAKTLGRYSARRGTCAGALLWLLVLLPGGASALDQKPGLLAGTYVGPLKIERDTDLSGIVNGDVTVLAGARLAVSGMVNGRLIVNKDARAIVNGIANGTITNDGGFVEINGTYGSVNTFDGGDTRIAASAKQISTGAGSPFSEAQSIATMEQFKIASPEVRSLWALSFTDQVMLYSPVNDFVIRPIRAKFAEQFEGCVEAQMEKGENFSLVEVTKECSSRLASEHATAMKKQAPQAVADFLKQQDAHTNGVSSSRQETSSDEKENVSDRTPSNAAADQVVPLPDGKKVRLKKDGTYEIVSDDGEGEAERYSEISILDLKVDLKSLNGKLVRTRGRGTYFAQDLILTDPNVDFDINGINVMIENLSREDRKWIVANCTDGCAIVVEGQVRTDSFLPMLAAHSIRHR